MELTTAKTFLIVIILSLLYMLEVLVPFFIDRKEKLSHGLKNILLGVLNALVIAVFFSSLVLLVSGSYFALEFGLFNQFTLPYVLQLMVIIILFDLWMYGWHVMNHKLPFFWRFHKVHHSDEAVDVTSALRFHTGEIILSSMFRVGIIMLLGLQPWHIILYEIILLPVIMFHHSNVAISERVDKLYRVFFASPRMHWVHHSDYQPETDSNYGSIFSFWDRLFSTFRIRKDPENITQGLKQYRSKEWSTLLSIIKVPFIKKK